MPMAIEEVGHFRSPLHAWRYGTNKKWESEMGCMVDVAKEKVVVSKEGVVLQEITRGETKEVVDYFVTGRIIVVGCRESLFLCVDKEHGQAIRQALEEDFLKDEEKIRRVDYQQFFTLQKTLKFPQAPAEEPSTFMLNEEGEALASLQKQLKDLQFLNKGMDRMVRMLEEYNRNETRPMTYAVLHEDGDLDEEVPLECIRLSPNRPGNWGKHPNRGHNLIPDNAGEPGEGLYLGASVVSRWMLYHNDKDIRGTYIDAWFAGTIVSMPSKTGRMKLSHKRKQHQPMYVTETVPEKELPRTFYGRQPLPSPVPVYKDFWSVLHEDGDFDEKVPSDRIRLCPTRPDNWGKLKSNRGSENLPPNSGSPGQGLYHGARVVARWNRYRGSEDDAWFAGTLISPRQAEKRLALSNQKDIKT